MPSFSFRQLFDSIFTRGADALALGGRVESCPPDGWRGPHTWRLPQSRRQRSEAIAVARLDFADALFDVRTQRAIETLDRIAVARSLNDLWNLRDTLFGLVSHRHDQGEATRRLAGLDRHFPRRGHRFSPTRHGLAGGRGHEPTSSL